jgi:hypothetical protein
MVRVEVEDIGRPYVFKKEMFISDEDDKVEHGPETLFNNEMISSNGNGQHKESAVDDLPF